MCGAKKGGESLEGVDVAKESIIQGVVLRGEEPVATGYVRLLDRSGEFTAEVPVSATGQFRFFAAPGDWTLRALSRSGNGDASVSADRGLNEVAVTVAAA